MSGCTRLQHTPHLGCRSDRRTHARPIRHRAAPHPNSIRDSANSARDSADASRLDKSAANGNGGDTIVNTHPANGDAHSHINFHRRNRDKDSNYSDAVWSAANRNPNQNAHPTERNESARDGNICFIKLCDAQREF